MYLPLAEATVLNFLAPLGACAAVGFLSSGSFSWAEVISGVISLAGVILIAHSDGLDSISVRSSEAKPSDIVVRATGVGFAVLGALGGMVGCRNIYTYKSAEKT